MESAYNVFGGVRLKEEHHLRVLSEAETVSQIIVLISKLRFVFAFMLLWSNVASQC